MASAASLSPVPSAAAAEYLARSDDMRWQVDEELLRHPDLLRLIGYAPTHVMRANHENHAAFLAAVLRYAEYRMLARVVVWVYRAYLAHGFSPDYFRVELQAWVRAVRHHLTPATAAAIEPVYAWMLDHHEALLSASADAPPRCDGEWATEPVLDHLFDALTRGQADEVRRLALQHCRTKEDVAAFFVDIAQPTMVRIGQLWESGRLSVAQEHLASAVLSGVLAGLGVGRPRARTPGRKALVTAAPNELHQLGAWMVADVLEMEGWEVRFLGANTPVPDVVEMAEAYCPNLLGISVSMPFNLMAAHDLIRQIRSRPSLAKTRILVGGAGFADCPDVWRQLGADGFAADARGAARVAAGWQ